MSETAALVLKLLREGPQTPSELAETLRIPLTELRIHLDRLREKGMDIAPHPILGLELGPPPRHLVAEDIASRMEPCGWTRIETLDVTPSTNNLAMEHGVRGGTGPVAFFAEKQTAGRGRFGRIWESEAGEGLWMSLFLQPSAPMVSWPRLTTMAALALSEAIEATTSLTPLIKWPNDIVCREKKVAGILAETGSHPENGPFIVLGIGVNVNQTSFPEAISETAGSLRMLSGCPFNRSTLAAELLNRLQALIPLIHSDFSSVLEGVKKRSSVLGKHLAADLGGMLVHGTAEDLDSEGGLILLLPDGSRRNLHAGEVTLRR
jgi:BirA family biotin operon repressor/biotin-[acetyl-CoA-carboxylase] ligase